MSCPPFWDLPRSAYRRHVDYIALHNLTVDPSNGISDDVQDGIKETGKHILSVLTSFFPKTFASHRFAVVVVLLRPDPSVASNESPARWLRGEPMDIRSVKAMAQWRKASTGPHVLGTILFGPFASSSPLVFAVLCWRVEIPSSGMDDSSCRVPRHHRFLCFIPWLRGGRRHLHSRSQYSKWHYIRCFFLKVNSCIWSRAQ